MHDTQRIFKILTYKSLIFSHLLPQTAWLIQHLNDIGVILIYPINGTLHAMRTRVLGRSDLCTRCVKFILLVSLFSLEGYGICYIRCLHRKNELYEINYIMQIGYSRTPCQFHYLFLICRSRYCKIINKIITQECLLKRNHVSFGRIIE